MKTIGILGGLGAESTIPYYHHITHKYIEEYSNLGYPEIIIYSFNFQEFIDNGYRLPKKVKDAIVKLSKAGADFVIAACNSVHIVYEDVADDIPIPWVSIIDVTADHIKDKGWKKVGLLGTVYTMSNRFFIEGLEDRGIECMVPDMGFQKKVSDIIYDELVKGDIHDDSRAYMVQRVEALRDEGAEAVILGCTELPLLVSRDDTDVPLVNTTAIHAQRALDIAVGKVELPRGD